MSGWIEDVLIFILKIFEFILTLILNIIKLFLKLLSKAFVPVVITLLVLAMVYFVISNATLPL